MIIKKIHYIWLGKNPLSTLSKRCMDSWVKNCPGYEIVRWDESNIPDDIKFVNDMIKQKQWAFASDYLRLYFVYKYGGIYMDTDIELVRPIDSLLDNKCFFGYEAKNRPTTGIFGAINNHKLLRKCMDIIEQRHERNKPYLIAPEIAKVAISDYKDSDYVVYDEEYFYPYNPFDVERECPVLMFSSITDNTYAIHHWNHGWKQSLFQKIMKRLF